MTKRPVEGVSRVELVVLPSIVALDSEPGSVVVAHDQSGVDSPLAAGDEVVLLDHDRALHAGVVTALSVRDGRLHYTINQGVRLPPSVARRRLGDGRRTSPSAGAGEDDVLDLLGVLRDDDLRRVLDDEPRDEPGT